VEVLKPKNLKGINTVNYLGVEVKTVIDPACPEILTSLFDTV